MTEAQQAVRVAASKIPADVAQRLETAATLSDEDREAIIHIASRAIQELSPDSDTLPDRGPQTEDRPQP
jgi:hypothetical protein